MHGLRRVRRGPRAGRHRRGATGRRSSRASCAAAGRWLRARRRPRADRRDTVARRQAGVHRGHQRRRRSRGRRDHGRRRHARHSLHGRGGVQDLGELAGFGAQSYASAIASDGAIGGHADRADGTSVFFGHRYTAKGGRTEICPGSCSVWDLNGRGQVVGLIPGRDPTSWQAFLYTPEAGLRTLGTLGGARSCVVSDATAATLSAGSSCACSVVAEHRRRPAHSSGCG